MIQVPPEWWNKTNCEIAGLLGCTPTNVLFARRRALGLCERCKRKATKGRFCATHEKKVRRYQRSLKGHKPWKPGGRGRPPINRDRKEGTQ